jgi:Uma2 family endonuclease
MSERWQGLTQAEREKFPPLCPDFVIELRSRTDSLKPLQDKMREYIDNGLQLGWLINHRNRQVEIYRPGQRVEVIALPAKLSGELVLPGFELQIP